jgi:large subunit ribosomal protein L23|tara:strand:- start:883 stop:1191 length:309 start_codon:yes stop_codon:yes gene_type:complete
MNNQNIQFLKAPYVTEKTSRLTEESNQYVFKVSLDSTKLKIKKAVEDSYSVSVKDVQVIKMKGKTRRDRKSNKLRKKSDWKKAYVSLAEGQSIDMDIGGIDG